MSLDGAFALMPSEVDCGWTATDSPEARDLESADGVWLLPGTPYRDEEAAYRAIEYCRTSGTPFLGTCGGFQYACVELARSLAAIEGAAHAESDPDAEEPVVVPLQCSLYGETRTVEPTSGTRFAGDLRRGALRRLSLLRLRPRPPRSSRASRTSGVVLSARAPDAGVEAIELPDHPFFIATAFQPQVGNAESGALHPLITALLGAARA